MQISPALTSETAFVASALKKGLRSTVFADRNNYEAYAIINPLVNDLLTKAQVLVARRGSYAIGFAAYQDVDGVALVHVYVRAEERRKGYARELLDAALAEIDPSASLETFFPTDRWRETAERYGFYVTETL